MNPTYRQDLAAVNFCRAYLRIRGFLTNTENEKVHKRISKYQDRNRIEISLAQLMSVKLAYDDNAKDEDEIIDFNEEDSNG